jgi:hypothetical protein
MKMTRIITAKIRPGIMMKISDGGKRFEVRMESFHDADFIRYVDADHPHTQFSDGLRRLGRERRFSRDSDEFVRELSGVDEETFKELFPRPSLWVPEFTHRRDYLFVAPIGEPIALGQIFQENTI